MCAQSLRTFDGHSDRVFALALSPDGKTLFSGSVEKTIRAWSTESGAVRYRVCLSVSASSVWAAPSMSTPRMRRAYARSRATLIVCLRSR